MHLLSCQSAKTLIRPSSIYKLLFDEKQTLLCLPFLDHACTYAGQKANMVHMCTRRKFFVFFVLFSYYFCVRKRLPIQQIVVAAYLESGSCMLSSAEKTSKLLLNSPQHLCESLLRFLFHVHAEIH